MDSENELRHELAELNLLLRGLAKIPAFPAELLELISGKVESISRLTIQSEGLVVSDEQSCLSEETFSSSSSFLEPDINEFNQLKESTSNVQEIAGAKSLYSAPVSILNDQMVHRRFTDLTGMMTLNDRFRFQREFFGNDPQKMSEFFSVINKTQTKDEALDYLRGVCTVDEDSDCFQDLCMILNLHFANGSGSSPSN